MNCCNNSNISVVSGSRTFVIFIITSMWQEGSQGPRLAHLVTVPALNPQTCPGRRGVGVVDPAGVYGHAYASYASLFPISIGQNPVLWPQASGKGGGECSHQLCPGRGPKWCAEHKALSFFFTTSGQFAWMKEKKTHKKIKILYNSITQQ